ncbi:MAG: double-strand break repair protein AddB [Hyphomicrobiales bacterium]
MTVPLPRVYTIAPDRPFLQVLADAVLAGFPRADGRAPMATELARWTILLPTRRAVRELETVFFAKSGGRGLLLPAIRPVGDLDDELLDDGATADTGDLAPSMSAAGQLLLLVDLVDQWARENAHTRLAQEMAAAPQQAAALALSLKELLDGIETEEIDAAQIPDLYALENARHREAILDLLAIARQRYPQRLAEMGRSSSVLRRSQLLRREARRIAAGGARGPVIAAGSTGTIPATRDLLSAIARLPEGAVVLPGLDTAMDDDSWTAVGPVHPQHALKQLLGALGIGRGEVPELGSASPGPRAWLGSEIMRPAETSDAWGATIARHAQALTVAMAGVDLIETQHPQEEAEVIALILRNALETPDLTACLVTPDRGLARRVKAALGRWDIAIDDSGGEPLLRFGGASLLQVLMDAVARGFDAESLATLLRHDLCRLGHTPEEARHFSSIVELAALRREPAPAGIAALPRSLADCRTGGGERLHPALERLPEADWAGAIAFADRVAQLLAQLPAGPEVGFSGQVRSLVDACQALAGDALWSGDAGRAFSDAIAAAQADAGLLGHCDFARATAILTHLLRATALRPRNPRVSRLSILGLLEARLIRPDLVVLGGLNEGVWPGLADAGPWLNRPMRDVLAMQQPEQAIGQTAHDFVQALGCPEAKLVWSRRIDDAPAIPSRWVLRLQMILKAAGMTGALGKDSSWPRLARALNDPGRVAPQPKPLPRPPLAARPHQLSVTGIETLIRDPYAIYARHVLKLQPVEPLAGDANPARRGIIVHDVVSRFLTACPDALPPDALELLLRIGRDRFERQLTDPATFSFWWPRFERIAAWLVAEEAAQRPGIRRVHAEVEGRTTLAIGDATFILTCRADRVDVLTDGTARIVDYKTGSVPSAKEVKAGLAPQLTLQAAILGRGGFAPIAAMPVSQVSYVRLSGGDPAGEDKGPGLGGDLPRVVEEHVVGVVALIAAYRDPEQAYLPRAMMKHEDDASPYDHLSRYREWALAGEPG